MLFLQKGQAEGGAMPPSVMVNRLSGLLLGNAVHITAAKQNFPSWHCDNLMLWEDFT